MTSLTKKSTSQLQALKKEQLQAIELHQKREYLCSNKSEYNSTLKRLQKRLEEIESALPKNK